MASPSVNIVWSTGRGQDPALNLDYTSPPLTAQSRSQDSPSVAATAKNYACLPCRQRKIKCDRQIPCSHCVKSKKECSFVPPTRGKRKRLKPSKDELRAKIARYEELLKAQGADLQAVQGGIAATGSARSVGEDSESATEDAEDDDNGSVASRGVDHTDRKPTLVHNDGRTRFFERYITLSGSRL
jgi:hypothetical protein